MAGIENRELLNSTAVDDGTWIACEQFNVPFSVDVQGIVGADRVQIRVSNDKTKPSNAVHERQLGTDISANGVTEVTSPYKWIKARKSAADGAPGTTIVWLLAQLIH